MTRTGKIARLPFTIRTQLNRRLRDGEVAARLVEWLNSLPETQEVLDAEFGGRPINEQNLSEWRVGGYADWEKQEEARTWLREFIECTDNISAANNGQEISHRLAGFLSLELTRTLLEIMQQPTNSKERLQCITKALTELHRLRAEDRKAGWLQIARARHEVEVEDRERAAEAAEAEAEAEEYRIAIKELEERRAKDANHFFALLQLDAMAKSLGGGNFGRHAAAFTLETTCKLDPGTLSAHLPPLEHKAPKAKASKAKSTPLKPNQASPDPGGGPPPAEPQPPENLEQS